MEWTESCPFNKAEKSCRAVSVRKPEETVLSAWEKRVHGIQRLLGLERHVSETEADNGSCDVYMKNPACTASR